MRSISRLCFSCMLFLSIGCTGSMENKETNIKLPTDVPFEQYEQSEVKETAWPGDEKQEVYSLKFLNENAEKEHIEFIIAHFDRSSSEIEEDTSYEQLELEGGTTAYYKTSDFPSAELHWIEDGTEYNLHHHFFTDNQDKVKDDLIKMAESVK